MIIVDLILASLEEYLIAKGYSAHGETDTDVIKAAKERVAKAFDQYVQYNIMLAFEERRKKSSAEKIMLAEAINTQVKDTSTTIRAMTALNAAPPPLEDHHCEDPEAIIHWMGVYRSWYAKEREKSMEIG